MTNIIIPSGESFWSKGKRLRPPEKRDFLNSSFQKNINYNYEKYVILLGCPWILSPCWF
jgi:hypothetical protein